MQALHPLRVTLVAAAALIFTPWAGAAYLPSFSALYAFGDSLMDPGNVYRITRQPGAVGDALPDFPQPPYFEGRFSNGYNFADRISQRLFGDPSTPWLAGGTNYAIGGATTGLDNVALPQADGGMLAQYGAYATQHIAADPRALYIVFGGSNDVFELVRALPGLDPAARAGFVEERIAAATGNLATIVGALLAGGARDILVPNLPDLGRTPTLSGTGLEGAGSAATLAFNQALAGRLDMLPDTGAVVTLDVYSLFGSAVTNPDLYGLTEVLLPCFPEGLSGNPTAPPCANPDGHLFWDEMHPTARAHAILAAAALDALAVAEPQTAALLVFVLLMLGGARIARRGAR